MNDLDHKSLWRRLTGDGLFPFGCLAAFVLHLCALDALPWMDEVHIVEMGRLVLSGGAAPSILVQPDGHVFTPLYYLGPCCHEWAFRLGGAHAVRLLPMLALIAAAALCRRWLKSSGRGAPWLADVMGWVVLTQPLFVQSVRLVRIDAAVFALAFATLCLIDVQGGLERWRRIVGAGALMGLAPFVWPTAILLYPLYGTVLLMRTKEDGVHGAVLGRAIGLLTAGLLLAAGVLLVPVCGRMAALLASIGEYFRGPGAVATEGSNFSFRLLAQGVGVLLAKESLRNPFLYLMLPVGCVLACRRNRLLVMAFLASSVGAIAANLHTFRFIYLYPYLLLFFLLGAAELERRFRKPVCVFLALTIVYGVLTGPVAYALAAAIRGDGAREAAFRSRLEEHVGRGPLRVLSADYRTYYIGRALGWRQSAYSEPPMLVTDAAHLLAQADIIIEPSPDPFAAIEESHTLYGLLRDWALATARRETNSAAAPSPLGRLGAAFTFNHFTDETVAGLRKAYSRNGFTPAGEINLPGIGKVRLFKR